VCQRGRPWTGGGGGGGRQSTGRPQTKKIIAFRESVLESDTSDPPVHRRPHCNKFCVSDVYTRDMVQTSVDGRGGFFFFSKRTMLDRGEGGCSKSKFLLGRL